MLSGAATQCAHRRQAKGQLAQRVAIKGVNVAQGVVRSQLRQARVRPAQLRLRKQHLRNAIMWMEQAQERGVRSMAQLPRCQGSGPKAWVSGLQGRVMKGSKWLAPSEDAGVLVRAAPTSGSATPCLHAPTHTTQ